MKEAARSQRARAEWRRQVRWRRSLCALARFLGVITVVAALGTAPRPPAREVTDMLGRRVAVPDRVAKVIPLSPPATYLVYAIDPALVGGLNFPLRDHEQRYVAESYRRLPVIGGRVGDGRLLNLEVLLREKPDLVLSWARGAAPDAVDGEYERMLGTLGIPVVYAHFDSLRDSPAAFRFLGDLLGREARAGELARYAEEVLARLDRTFAGLPAAGRVPVYYAEGPNGLATEGEGSWHAQLIPLCGGRNVRPLDPQAPTAGMVAISLEQLYLYDPAVILVKEPLAHDAARSDPRWKRLRAVRDGKVFLIPHLPFNWFDRPPSFMRLLGAQWLAHQLHPDRFPVDLVAETVRFYRLFLGVDLTEAEAREVLGG